MKKLAIMLTILMLNADFCSALTTTLKDVNPNQWVRETIIAPDGTKKFFYHEARPSDLDEYGRFKPGVVTLAQAEAQAEREEILEQIEAIKNAAENDGSIPDTSDLESALTEAESDVLDAQLALDEAEQFAINNDEATEQDLALVDETIDLEDELAVVSEITATKV